MNGYAAAGERAVMPELSASLRSWRRPLVAVPTSLRTARLMCSAGVLSSKITSAGSHGQVRSRIGVRQANDADRSERTEACRGR